MVRAVLVSLNGVNPTTVADNVPPPEKLAFLAYLGNLVAVKTPSPEPPADVLPVTHTSSR